MNKLKVDRNTRKQFGCVCGGQGSCVACMIINLVQTHLGTTALKFLASRLKEPIGEPDMTKQKPIPDGTTHPDDLVDADPEQHGIQPPDPE